MKRRRVSRALRPLFVLALVAAILAVSTGIASARRDLVQGDHQDGRAAANALLEQTGAASLSLALVSGDRVVWAQGFGYADKATSTPPGADTMYGIGSVSKMLATVAAMKLVDRGTDRARRAARALRPRDRERVPRVRAGHHPHAARPLLGLPRLHLRRRDRPACTSPATCSR